MEILMSADECRAKQKELSAMTIDEKIKLLNGYVESDDLIDRQMAVEAVRDLFKRIPTRAIRAMHAIRSLPPAKPRSLDE